MLFDGGRRWRPGRRDIEIHKLRKRTKDIAEVENPVVQLDKILDHIQANVSKFGRPRNVLKMIDDLGKGIAAAVEAADKKPEGEEGFRVFKFARPLESDESAPLILQAQKVLATTQTAQHPELPEVHIDFLNGEDVKEGSVFSVIFTPSLKKHRNKAGYTLVPKFILDDDGNYPYTDRDLRPKKINLRKLTRFLEGARLGATSLHHHLQAARLET